MKSRYISNTAEAEKLAHRVAAEELERQRKILCPACEHKTRIQAFAVVLWILKRDHRHSAQWLNRLKNEIECELKAMDLPQIGAKPYDFEFIIGELEKFGIDFNESIWDK